MGVNIKSRRYIDGAELMAKERTETKEDQRSLVTIVLCNIKIKIIG